MQKFYHRVAIKTIVALGLSITVMSPMAFAAVENHTVNIEMQSEYQQMTGVINKDNVNFYVRPLLSADVFNVLDFNTIINVISVSDIWCKVEYNGITGYILSACIDVNGQSLRPIQGIVTGSSVNIRTGSSTKYSIINTVSAGTILELLDKVDNWYHINYNGLEGYISAKYVRKYIGNTPSIIGQQVVELAMNYLDVPYVWGGETPHGFDCSGFTRYVFKQFGYDLPHSASYQWLDCGEYVERDNLQPGDLIMFYDPAHSNGKVCSHVGIYIGNNEFIHAASGSGYVRISNLSSNYYNTYYKGAKRLGIIT